MNVPNQAVQSVEKIRERIYSFILEKLAAPKGIASFTDEDPLMEIGVIDSLDIFRLVTFLEEELGVRIENQEINIQTLGSVQTIEQLVLSKREQQL